MPGLRACRHVQTLVMDLDDVLVHSDWTRGRGWRTFKRPGASDFIKHMAPYYEMVVYTSQVCHLPALPDTVLCPNWPATWLAHGPTHIRELQLTYISQHCI